jgi:hypothetical protein
MTPPYQINTTHNIPEELVAMLVADMTVGQAVAEHRKNWGFRTDQGLEHELAHLILGLAGIPKYQKDMGIEIYVVAIETHLSLLEIYNKDIQKKPFQENVLIQYNNSKTLTDNRRALGALIMKALD